jgi:hypothetical protein
MNQTIAEPNRVEHAGLFRQHRRLNQFRNIGENEQRARKEDLWAWF